MQQQIKQIILIVAISVFVSVGTVLFFLNLNTGVVTEKTTDNQDIYDNNVNVDKDEVVVEPEKMKQETSLIIPNPPVANQKVSWNIYKNDFFGFSIEHPEEYELCLNDFCDNSFDGEHMSYVMLQSSKDAANEKLTNHYINIRPIKNLLNKTAIEFGKQQEIENKKDGNLAEIGKTVLFAGQSAYSFEVDGGFVQLGASISDKGITEGDGYEGEVKTGRHRVIYFDKDNYLYRIIYPMNDLIVESIMNTFAF